MKLNESYINIFLLISFLILAIYLSFIGGYGSDEDTLAMIYVFQRKLYEGVFATSRFTGYPVVEIGIGFLSHFFGSWAANLVTFIFLLLGLIFFYKSMVTKYKNLDLIFFLIFVLSSPVLFFDNLEPMDYSWALFFFSIGLYSLKKNYFELAVLFFALSIGSRINYGLFIIFTIFFFRNTIDIKRKLIIIFCSIFIGCLFYLPIWYEYKFSLNWLTAARPLEQGYLGLFYRTIYKLFLISGGLITFYMFFYIYLNRNKMKYISNYLTLIALIVSNILLFFWIPSELSYLQVYLISLYFIFFELNKKKIIYYVIIFNLITWFVNISFLDIEHRFEDKCEPIQAISANFTARIDKGFYSKYIDSRKMIECWVDKDSPRGIKIINGDPLK